MEESALVRTVLRRLRARVASGDDDDVPSAPAIAALAPLERAVYATRTLEDELVDGGWYLVFANEDEELVPTALAGYELLGLRAYAAHLRDVLATGYGDDSSDAESERLDDAYAALDGAEAARERALREAGITG